MMEAAAANLVEVATKGNTITLQFGGREGTITATPGETYSDWYLCLRMAFATLVLGFEDRSQPLLSRLEFSFLKYPTKEGGVRATVRLRRFESESFRPGEATANTERDAFIKAAVAALNEIAFNNKRRIPI